MGELEDKVLATLEKHFDVDFRKNTFVLLCTEGPGRHILTRGLYAPRINRKVPVGKIYITLKTPPMYTTYILEKKEDGFMYHSCIDETLPS